MGGVEVGPGYTGAEEHQVRRECTELEGRTYRVKADAPFSPNRP